MAEQLKSLKFSDNVLDYRSSYDVGGSTYNAKNFVMEDYVVADDGDGELKFVNTSGDIHVVFGNPGEGGVEVYDHCGNGSISFFSEDASGHRNHHLSIEPNADEIAFLDGSDTGIFNINPSCGRFAVSNSCGFQVLEFSSNPSDGAFFEVRDTDYQSVSFGESCGDFVVRNSCGADMLSFSVHYGAIFQVSDDIYSLSFGEQCGNFVVLDSCGDTVMKLDTGLITVGDGAGNYMSFGEHCGNFSVLDSCGSSLLDVGSGTGTNFWSMNGEMSMYAGAVFAGNPTHYPNAPAASGNVVCSGVWVPSIGGLKVGSGAVYVDSNGFLKASGFN